MNLFDLSNVQDPLYEKLMSLSFGDDYAIDENAKVSKNGKNLYQFESDDEFTCFSNIQYLINHINSYLSEREYEERA